MSGYLDSIKEIFFPDEVDPAAMAVGSALPMAALLKPEIPRYATLKLNDITNAGIPTPSGRNLATIQVPTKPTLADFAGKVFGPGDPSSVFPEADFLFKDVKVNPTIHIDPVGDNSSWYSRDGSKLNLNVHQVIDDPSTGFSSLRVPLDELAHELGHASAAAPDASLIRRALSRASLISRDDKLQNAPTRLSLPRVGMVLSPLTAGTIADDPLEGAALGAGFQTLVEAPVLAEEAYASLRGRSAFNRLRDAMSSSLDIKEYDKAMTAAYKTYLNAAAPRIAIAGLGASLASGLLPTDAIVDKLRG